MQVDGEHNRFSNFDLITPNEKEGRFALADQDSTVTSLSDSLIDKTSSKYLIMKLSERGILHGKTNKKIKFFALDLALK